MQLTSILVSLAVVAGVSSARADVSDRVGKTIDCYCTDSSGTRIELGETICMFVDGTMFMAQCQMSLNVPMWRKLGDGCTTSHLNQSRPKGQQATPL